MRWCAAVYKLGLLPSSLCLCINFYLENICCWAVVYEWRRRGNISRSYIQIHLHKYHRNWCWCETFCSLPKRPGAVRFDPCACATNPTLLYTLFTYYIHLYTCVCVCVHNVLFDKQTIGAKRPSDPQNSPYIACHQIRMQRSAAPTDQREIVCLSGVWDCGYICRNTKKRFIYEEEFWSCMCLLYTLRTYAEWMRRMMWNVEKCTFYGCLIIIWLYSVHICRVHVYSVYSSSVCSDAHGEFHFQCHAIKS